jgi:hypothetical protein
MKGIIEVSSHKTTESDNNFAIGSVEKWKYYIYSS